jgi:hypothetical protein
MLGRKWKSLSLQMACFCVLVEAWAPLKPSTSHPALALTLAFADREGQVKVRAQGPFENAMLLVLGTWVAFYIAMW